MVAGNSPEDLVAYNHRAFESLRRAIAFSQDKFSLVLVSCNYGVLREQVLQKLQGVFGDKSIQRVYLPHNAISVYGTVHSEVSNEQLKALMVLGLESVETLEELLSTINHIRDEFRKSHPFPMVFWLTDEVERKLIKLAPDFTSWGATPIRFDVETQELRKFLQRRTDILFANILSMGNIPADKPHITHPKGTLGQIWDYSSYEFRCAIRELKERGIDLEPELRASLDFVFGLDEYVSDRIESARRNFRQSLQYWEMHQDEVDIFQSVDLDSDFVDSDFVDKNGHQRNDSSGHIFYNQEFNNQESNNQESNNQESNNQINQQDILEAGVEEDSQEQSQQLNQNQLNQDQLNQNQLNQNQLNQNQLNQNQLNQNPKNLIFECCPIPPSRHILRQGVLLFYVGLCDFRSAQKNHTQSSYYWQEAKSYFQDSLEVFATTGRPDIIAQFIGQLSEVLHHLQQWSELQKIAQQSLDLHQNYGTQIQLACDYGYLADVALQEKNWTKAAQLAQACLFCLAEAQEGEESHECLFPELLQQIYQLVLAKAQKNLGEKSVAQQRLHNAAKQLPQALNHSDHRYDAYRYIWMLRRLRSLYFESSCYLEAFDIRQKRRSVEQQYGFRAFIGAGRLQPLYKATNPVLSSPTGSGNVALEIVASGRERDINRLIGRISRPDKKLTVIHGPSGVGKSSTVTGGLVPALQHRAIGDQLAVPVVLQVYTEWVRELGKSLQTSLLQMQLGRNDEELAEEPDSISSISEILEQLKQNGDNYLITVLIFDQFEEFFFGTHGRKEKEVFDRFICDCLNIPFVKVIFSLREDYLHNLLDFKYLGSLSSIDDNILDKNIRYQLKNFSPADTRQVIHKLTERSQINLEDDLIAAIVQDLSADMGEVRPIELQVVGMQLQDERITSLAQYEQFRPNKLIERYVKKLIEDCGPENSRAALLVLYLLTDENKQRPFKTRAELATEIADLEEEEKLELVLEILVKSGLVVLFRDVPERYQLIHDYLVDLIRYLQNEESGLQEQLSNLWEQVQQRESEIAHLNSQLKQKKQSLSLLENQPSSGYDLLKELKDLRKREELSRVEIERLVAEREQQKLELELQETEKQRVDEARINRVLKIALTASVSGILALTISIGLAVSLWRQAQINTSTAASTSSEAFFGLGKDIDALKEGLKAGRKLKGAFFTDAKTRQQVKTSLYQAIYGMREREHNRLQKHTALVKSVSFNRNGSLIASAGADRNILIWRKDGGFVRTIRGHKNWVNSVAFSQDDKYIVSGSADKTVKLWKQSGKLLQDITGHEDIVHSVAFSPDGKYIVSGSADKTVRIWNLEGKEIVNIEAHTDKVRSVAWSPDGDIIASSSNDKTIKLWTPQGELLTTLVGHEAEVVGLAWSPDNQTIASASNDKTVKLWNRQGKLLNTLKEHKDAVTSVSFSPDSSTIASGSLDNTIKLWKHQSGSSKNIEKENLDSNNLENKNLDKNNLDKKNLEAKQINSLETLTGHSNWVTSVAFSPDGHTLASASRDTTVKLWRWKDGLLKKFKPHNKTVTSISFSPTQNLIASASVDKTVKISNYQGRVLQVLKGHQDTVWKVAFSPDGNTLASASKDKTIKIWNTKGQLLRTLQGHDKTVLAVAWSNDGKILASASSDRTVKLWNTNGKLLKNLEGHDDEVSWVSFSPDGKYLASASDDNTVIIWDTNGNLIHRLEGHQRPVYSVAWSPDSKAIASASLDGTVKLWDTEGNLQKTLIGESDNFKSISFSPDGEILAVTSDEKVRIWNRQGTLLITLKGYNEDLTNLAFSKDNKTLASSTSEGGIILRQLEDFKLDNLLNRGCDLLQEYLQTNSKVTPSDRSLCE